MMSHIYIDAQILQTPALHRGMGQYLISLVKALAEEKETQISLILSSSHLLKRPENKMFSEYKNVNVSYVDLLARTHTKDTKKALEHNKKTITSFLGSVDPGSAFIIGSLFQTEIYPAFPDLPGIQKLLICYDAIPLQRFAEYSPKMQWQDYLTRHSEYYLADKYLCISRTVANDLQIYTSIDPQKLFVINGGAGDTKHINKPATLPSKKFIFMPTGNDIRKNNHRAIEAFEFYRKERDKDLTLVISSFFTDVEKDILNNLSPNILFTGVVSTEEINWYYANCELVLFPSLYEGLGMPIIEAMHFGKPIAASSIEVFKEITEKGVTYFNPYDTNSLMAGIDESLEQGLNAERLKAYEDVLKEYTWKNTAQRVFNAIDNIQDQDIAKKPYIAVVGPHTTGISAIGKVIQELHAETSRRFKVDYYYEKSHSDIVLRPDILGNCANYFPIQELTDRNISKYDAVIYHIGNSNHHAITYARAIKYPSIVVLHDLNIEGVYKELVERNIIDEKRKDAEEKVTHSEKTKYTGTLTRTQKTLITHSNYAAKILSEIGGKVSSTQLPIDTPKFYKKNRSQHFTVGMAGIIAGIKGVETIEKIASHPNFINDRILIFGINFAEPGLLDRVLQMSNVEVATNLSDYEFQEKLKELDVFVNYRTHYQGEASQATLESMRWGIPVIVRGDFGWYAELPDEAVVKVQNEKEALDKLFELKTNDQFWAGTSRAATRYTEKYANQKAYVDLMEKIVKGLKK